MSVQDNLEHKEKYQRLYPRIFTLFSFLGSRGNVDERAQGKGKMSQVNNKDTLKKRMLVSSFVI